MRKHTYTQCTIIAVSAEYLFRRHRPKKTTFRLQLVYSVTVWVMTKYYGRIGRWHLLQIVLDCFANGLSMDNILLNWVRLKEMMAKIGFVVPPRVIDGICNFKDGAAELFLEELYRHITGRQISKVKPRHRVDFTDHAYQVNACMLRRIMDGREWHWQSVWWAPVWYFFSLRLLCLRS